jgi:ketosteroid isomerase-like protein
MDEDATRDTILALEREALTRWCAGDTLGYAARLADTATYFDHATRARLEGAEAIRGHVAQWQGKIQVPRFEMAHPAIHVAGDVAVLAFNFETYSAQGELTSRWNATSVYRRVEGEWRLVHAHWAVIDKELL